MFLTKWFKKKKMDSIVDMAIKRSSDLLSQKFDDDIIYWAKNYIDSAKKELDHRIKNKLAIEEYPVKELKGYTPLKTSDRVLSTFDEYENISNDVEFLTRKISFMEKQLKYMEQNKKEEK
jgi:hypothetical protein